MTASLRLAALTALLLCATASAGSARIQCWTDEQGQRACGNSVPAKYADKQREVLNERGQVVETKSRAPTIEEVNGPAKPDVIETSQTQSRTGQ